MQLIAKEIYNTFRNYKADIFFVAALTIVSVVLLDFYNIDMVNNKGKRHINVITIEGYKNKKEDLKRKNELMKKAQASVEFNYEFITSGGFRRPSNNNFFEEVITYASS